MYILMAIIAVALGFVINIYLGLAMLAAMIAYGIYTFIPQFYAMRGNALFNEGNYQGAAEYYKKAVDTGHAKPNIRASYAFVLLRAGEPEKAEEVLDKLLYLKGIKPVYKNQAKQTRCMAYYKQGRLDEALEDALELFEGGYKTSTTYGMIGYFKLLRGDDLAETTKFCEEAYDYNNEDRDIVDNLSICYFRAGRYEDARKLSDELIAAEPKFAEAFFHGAQIQQKLGNKEKALEYLDHLPECTRSYMTTVSEEDIEKLRAELNKM